MFLFSWLRKTTTSIHPIRQAARRRFRPTFEALEGRSVPAILSVTTALDVVNPSDGVLSLREAIQQANPATPGGDTIVFDSSLNGQTITLNGSELLLDKNLNIQGPGAAQLAISGNHQSRVFEVAPWVAGSTLRPQVSLAKLTIRDGNAGNTGSSGGGGGIFNWGTLTLTDCTLSGNSAYRHGGAIRNYATAASLTLDGCTFSDNSTMSGDGGGIYSDSNGTLKASNCVFSGNSSAGSGGAIHSFNFQLSLSDCTFSGNTARDGSGGAIFHTDGTSATFAVTLSGCTLSGNSAHYLSRSQAGSGGAIYTTAGSTMLTACTLSGNSAVMGGAIYSSQGYSYQAVTLTGCTISGNSADIGGGIYNAYFSKATLTIKDCTISGNTATSKGGGIYNNGATIIQNTKVQNNSAGLQGGGIFNDSSGVLTLYSSSILSGNLAPDGADLYNLGRVTKKKA